MHQGLRGISKAAAIAACLAAAAALLDVGGHADAATTAAPAPTLPPRTQGPMVGLQYLVGSWSCDGTPKSPETSVKLVISIAYNNTLQVVSHSRTSTMLGFYGYDAVPKLWWSVNVDNDGTRSFQTSSNRANFNGTMETRDKSFPVRTTTLRISDTKFRTVTDEQIDGTWVRSGDATCTKP